MFAFHLPQYYSGLQETVSVNKQIHAYFSYHSIPQCGREASRRTKINTNIPFYVVSRTCTLTDNLAMLYVIDTLACS